MPPKRGRVQVDASPTKSPVVKRTRKDSDASLPPKKQSPPEAHDTDASLPPKKQGPPKANDTDASLSPKKQSLPKANDNDPSLPPKKQSPAKANDTNASLLNELYDEFDEDEEDQDQSRSKDELVGLDHLEPDLRNRLNYIHRYTKNLTSTFLRMIFVQLHDYMGPRGGGNEFVAASIVQHCYVQAMNKRSKLIFEKRLVHDAYLACFGGCGMEDDKDDLDFYDVPRQVQERLRACSRMLFNLSQDSLTKIVEQIPTFKKPTSDGEAEEEEEEEIDSDDILGHLEVLAGRRGDIVKEEEIIREEWKKMV